MDTIDEANQRIEDLEIELAKLPPKQGSSATWPNMPAGQNVTGIRRAIAANGGGVIPRYGMTTELKQGDGLGRAIAANALLIAAKSRA